MKKANIKGALVGIEAVTPEGPEGGLQGLASFWRRIVRQLQTFKRARRSRAGFVHLWATDRQAIDVRLYGGDGAEGGSYLCTVCDDDAVSGHGGFWAMGKGTGREPTNWLAMCRLPATG